MAEKENIKEVQYCFTIYAYRLEKDGKRDPSGVEVEHSKKITNPISKLTYEMAYETAISYGMRDGYYPTRLGYYGHWAGTQ